MSETLLDGVELERSDEALVLRAGEPLQVLSTAVLGGGRRSARSIVNLHVPKGYDCRKPEHDIRTFARQHGLAAPVIGLMTAVALGDVQPTRWIEGDVHVFAVITVGLANARRAGDASPGTSPGTINSVFLVEAHLHEAAAIELVAVAAEAKASALAEADVRTHEGKLASGTSTDATVIAWRRRGRTVRYAGTATPVGRAVATLMRDAVARVVASR